MEENIMESSWSESVSNDPKHRPQLFDRPSTTVRREWCRRPQEAHIADGDKYRRLSVKEIATIQGFPYEWIDVDGISEKDRIAALGNAVPPPLSCALSKLLKDNIQFQNDTLLEICAGIGGLSYGFDYLKPIAKIEMWDVGARILRTNKPWPASCVIEGMAQDYDYSKVQGRVGLLCGGPPCQPWSQAGHQKGAEDPRDVMGYTPTIIAACEPEVFLFENVPGLFTSREHRAYVEDLLGRMRAPKEGVRYGVATTIVNAADFGVPQIRKRVLILGIKGKSNTFANKIIDKLKYYETHHNPLKPAVGKQPWVTLRQAFQGIETTEQWKRLNLTDESRERLENLNSGLMSNVSEMNSEGNRENDNHNSVGKRIELVWPGKNEKLFFENEKWTFKEHNDQEEYSSLINVAQIGNISGETRGSVVIGDYIRAMTVLNNYVQNSVQMIYFDAPRIGVLINESNPGYAESTWLSLVKEVASKAVKVMKPNGFFVLHTDEEMAHYGRQVLDEVFGYFHHVSTFAWQKKYAPQNDKTKKTPTDVFDYISVYSKCDPDMLPKIGILKRPDDLIDDGDWRGVYKAGHKGARSGSEATKFHVCAPPYRWEIIEESLPEGRHWFDPITGVLWFEKVESFGEYALKVKAKDKDGNECTKEIKFTIRKPSDRTDSFEMPDRVWWLLKDDNEIVTGGDLKIIEDVKEGVEGSPYCIVFKAQGGTPYTMRSSAPGQNRYWEFSLNTLIKAITTASASFGKNGNALPSRKTYYPRDNAFTRSAVMNWLPYQEYGKTEDASRHVKALRQNGLTTGNYNLTAKPQKLLSHLINLFAPNERDLVISVGDINAVMACTALKLNRDFIHITGGSKSDLENWENTGMKRIEAVIKGEDVGEIEKDDPMPCEYSVPNASIRVMDFMKSVILNNKKLDIVIPQLFENETVEDLYAGLVGAVKVDPTLEEYEDYAGRKIIVLSPDDILDATKISYYSTKYKNTKVVILSERIEDEARFYLPQNVTVLHAPYELINRR